MRLARREPFGTAATKDQGFSADVLSAPQGGTSVNLGFVSTLGTVSPNPLVIPQGASSGTAAIVLKYIGGNASVKVTATNGGTPAEAPLQIKGNNGTWNYHSPCFHSGCVGAATITLFNPAPAGGLPVSLHSDNAQLTVPSSATIPAGQTEGTVPLTWGRIVTPGRATLTGKLGGGLAGTPDLGVFLDLKTGGRVASVTPSSTSVVSGSEVNFNVALESPAPREGPVVVSYTWGNTTGTLDVSPGTQTKSVTLEAPYVKAATTATAIFQSTTSANAPTGIVPARVAVAPLDLASLQFQSSQITGGDTATGVVALNGAAPREGMTIALQSDAPALAATPRSVSVAGGARFAQFPVTTTRTANSATVTITATAATGKALTSQLVVNPSSRTMTLEEVQK